VKLPIAFAASTLLAPVVDGERVVPETDALLADGWNFRPAGAATVAQYDGTR